MEKSFQGSPEFSRKRHKPAQPKIWREKTGGNGKIINKKGRVEKLIIGFLNLP